MEILHLDQISPDAVVLWKWKFFALNATILYTWIIMTMLTLGSWLVTRNLSTEPKISRWQNLLEVIVVGMRNQIIEVCQRDAGRYLYQDFVRIYCHLESPQPCPAMRHPPVPFPQLPHWQFVYSLPFPFTGCGTGALSDT